MRIAPLVALLLVAACTPVRGSAPVGLTPAHGEQFCQMKGGHLARFGKDQHYGCLIPYADAGKACTDGAQCLGKRCTGEARDEGAGAPAAGRCVADNNPFGCNTVIEAGVARTICVD